VMLVITGVKSKQILGTEEVEEVKRETSLKKELDIDFID